MTHFFSDYPPRTPDEERCRLLAVTTWKRLPWTARAVPEKFLPRLVTGDGRRIPWIRDVFDAGVTGLLDDEITVYTNAHIQVRSDAVLHTEAGLRDVEAGYCFRRDFPPRLSDPVPDALYPSGHNYCGSDLYAFRARWWRKHRGNFPDMLIAYEGWDPVLRHLIERTIGGRYAGLGNLIAHEKDGDSWWEHPARTADWAASRQTSSLTSSMRPFAPPPEPILPTP